MNSPRETLKSLAYGSGLARLYHRARNRRQLTVAMFHRVLADGDPRWRAADPAWAVSERLFAECLEFFTDYYRVISFGQLLAARQDAALLPDYPLLITFDDGWADNAEYALPGLKKHGLPALLFLVAEAVNRGELWDERLRYAGRRNAIRGGQWRRLSAELNLQSGSMEEMIASLTPMEPERREHLAASLVEDPDASQAAMVSRRQLSELIAGGVTIGSHGLTHTPVPRAFSPDAEIAGSRAALREMLRMENPRQEVLSLSFPHGVYEERSIAAARQAGYEFIFTSDQWLTPLEAGKPLPPVIGRIHISGPDISNARGGLDAAKLAWWLFGRAPASAVGEAA
jgi:peptidoglycan/xylan/chitin deacetylase (PgdA/CDA1 family)